MFLLQASVKKIQKKAIKTSTTTCATYHVTSQEGCTTVAAGMCHSKVGSPPKCTSDSDYEASTKECTICITPI